MHAARGSPQQKHVIAILADDYGWADSGWHRPEGYEEVKTIITYYVRAPCTVHRALYTVDFAVDTVHYTGELFGTPNSL